MCVAKLLEKLLLEDTPTIDPDTLRIPAKANAAEGSANGIPGRRRKVRIVATLAT